MNGSWFRVISLACVVLLAGCSQSPPLAAYRPYDLGQAESIVVMSVEWMGGLAEWRKVDTVRADALLTIYDARGQASVSRQEQTIDLGAGTITAEERTPQGPLRIKAGIDDIPPAPGGAAWALATLAHRVRGPLQLLGHAEQVESARPRRLGGHDVIRVAVKGEGCVASAYYFDATTGMLRYVTAGGDSPGDEGTVTAYEYMPLGPQGGTLPSGGKVFPRRITIVSIGEHVLIGDEPLLEVTYSNVSLD